MIAGATTYKAFYFNESEDSDSDGIKDWFEYRMWGDLTHGPTEDPDGMDSATNGKINWDRTP